jgi:hypothetical protein
MLSFAYESLMRFSRGERSPIQVFMLIMRGLLSLTLRETRCFIIYNLFSLKKVSRGTRAAKKQYIEKIKKAELLNDSLVYFLDHYL